MFASKRILFSVIGLTCLGVLLPLFTAYAQAPSQIVINYPEITDTDDTVSLGLYFTVVDSSGKVVPEAKAKSGTIMLDDGTRYEAQIAQPTSPFYIVLVLDASGSMSGAAPAMRDAAVQAVNNAPEEAVFAVVRFNDRIDVLQQFTNNRDQVISAIGQVQPVNLAGTCLYDATYTALDLLAQAPPGRRAVILFTDGRDETAQGDPCSRHIYNDVVTHANEPQSRAPVHTIGMASSEQNINAGELRNMASSTGGLSAIGQQQDLGVLFAQIMDALKSQWLATAAICPTAGQHTATLQVTLEDGTPLQPAVASFEMARDCFVPTATPTPVYVDIEIQAATFDPDADTVALDIAVQGEQVIGEYRFEFVGAETGLLLDRQTVPAPLPNPVVLPAQKLEGEVRIILRATTVSGETVEWVGDDNKPVDETDYIIVINRPTPTPAPVSPTPIPASATVNSIGYDVKTDTLILDLSLVSPEQMGLLEVNILDADTGLRVNAYNADPAEQVKVKATGLTPGHDYNIYVIVQNPTGQNIYRSNMQKFTYTPVLSPTPTFTPTPTLTPTPTVTPSPTATPPVQIEFGSINIDDNTQEVVIGIIGGEDDRIDHFELEVRNAQTGLSLGTFVHSPPPYEIRIPLSLITGGEYTVVLRAYSPDNTLLAQANPVDFAYSPPPTPTPEPTSTPSPTPPPPPEPSFVDRVTGSVRDNPILTLVVAVIAFGLLILLFLLLRPRRKPASGTAFLSAQTGFYQMSDLQKGGESALAPAKSKAAPAKPGDAPGKPAPSLNGAPAFHAAATDVFPQALLPPATLIVKRSPNPNRQGQSILITHVPFKVGRGGPGVNDLNLDEDTSVSRSHAQITFENGTFYIVDEKSSNGTTLDGQRLPAHTPSPLRPGSQIQIGMTTLLTFELRNVASSTDDPNKTDYRRIDETK